MLFFYSLPFKIHENNENTEYFHFYKSTKKNFKILSSEKNFQDKSYTKTCG